MHGTIKHQVYGVFMTITAFGESKHQAKEQIREKFANNSISNTWHNLGKELKIYSYRTAEQYRTVAIDLMTFVKENFKVKDIEKLTNEHVNAYLESKLQENIKYSTFQNYAAAIEKLELALNTFSKQYNKGNVYNFDISNIRDQAQKILSRSDPHRAYENPQALINAIKNDIHKTIAQAQLEGGLRIKEINHLSLSQFNDNSIKVKGKGGYVREIKLSETVYNNLKKIVSDAGGKLIFDPSSYRNSLKAAAKETKQAYTGSHGLRWSYAQNRMIELQKQGRTFNEARLIVSNELGHHRIDITSHYLR